MNHFHSKSKISLLLSFPEPHSTQVQVTGITILKAVVRNIEMTMKALGPQASVPDDDKDACYYYHYYIK